MSWNSFSGTVDRMECETGWFTVSMPDELNESLKEFPTGHFGFIPITARIASSTWDTSIMPYGDGSYFMALPKKIRTAQNIDRGDDVTIEFCLRG